MQLAAQGATNRFIPAGAGNTRRRFLIWCGDHGSSPRVRGTRELHHRSERQRRFIPAGAGNTALAGLPAPDLAVHPRGCGEHISHRERTDPRGGSSPRVRGTQSRVKIIPMVWRFIPAGAGNTTKTSPAPPPRPVHPRGCGEHSAFRSPASLSLGSSPRVRGTPTS